MSAAGVKLNGQHLGVYLSGISLPTGSANLTFAIWMCVKGANASNNGQTALGVYEFGAGTDVYLTDWSDDNTSPWALGLWCLDGSNNQQLLCAPLTDENWYYVLQHNSTTHEWSASASKDTIGTWSTCTAGTANHGDFNINTLWFGGTDHYDWQSNVEIRCARLWSGGNLLSTDQLLLEKKSKTAVLTANLYGDWSLNDTSTLTDASGNSHTLSTFGVVTNGSMDPVDLRDTASGGVIFGGLSITH